MCLEFGNWNGNEGVFHVGHSENLELQDIPRGFLIYVKQISMCLRGFFISFLPFIEGDGLP